MGCLYCGKEIGPIQLLKGSDFCSSAHRKRYSERLTKAIAEISRPEPTPPSAGFLDTIKSDSGGFRREARSAIFAGVGRPLEFPQSWRIEIAPLLGSQPRRLDCSPESRACNCAVADARANRLAALNAPDFAAQPATEGLPSGLVGADAPPESGTNRAGAAVQADNWLIASAEPATREALPRETAALAARTAALALNGALRLPNAETAGRPALVADQWLTASAQAAAREVQPSGFSALLARMAPPSSDRLLSIPFLAVSAQEKASEPTPAAASHWLAACAEPAGREVLPLASAAIVARTAVERPGLSLAPEDPFERAADPQTAPAPIGNWRRALEAQPADRAGLPETEVVDIRRQSDLRLTPGLELGIANPRMSADGELAALPAPEPAAREVQACAAPAIRAAQSVAKPALPSFAALPIRLVTDLPTAPGADLGVAAAVARHAPLAAERARGSRPGPQTPAFGLSPDFEAVAEDPVSCPVADLLPLEYHPHRVRASHTATLEWVTPHHTPYTPALLLGIPGDELEKHAAQPPKKKPGTPATVVTMPAPAAPPKKYDRWRAAGAVAAGLFVGMVVWGSAKAVHIGAGMPAINRDVSATAGQASLARNGAAAKSGAPGAPKSTASKGAMAWVRSIAAKRAAVDLTDSFRGMEAWGMPAKTWAPGWSRHPDGYVRTGQLAIFNPSREYQNYRLEFLAQVESKSIGWAVRAKDNKNYYAMKFKVVEPGLRPVIAMVHYPVIGGKPGQPTEIPLSVMIHKNEPYRVAVEVKGNRMVTSVEGQEVDTWTDNKLASGGIGFFSEAGERARLYWMKVAVNDDFIGRICAYFTASDTATASTWSPDLTLPQLLAWDTGARTKRPQYPELIQLGRLGTM